MTVHATQLSQASLAAIVNQIHPARLQQRLLRAALRRELGLQLLAIRKRLDAIDARLALNLHSFTRQRLVDQRSRLINQGRIKLAALRRLGEEQ